MATNDPLISVITPSYNQRESILWMLDAWQFQTAVFDDFELIISDDGSSDGTVKAVENVKAKYAYPIHILSHNDEGFRIARAKNDAIRLARGKYILVMDGDTYPGKDTVTAFLPHLDPETVLHAKRWRVDPVVLNVPFSWKILEKNKTRGEWRSETLPDIPPGKYTVFSGANAIIPTKYAKDLLWAPDDWNGFGYDDYNFALRWLATGKSIKFVDSVAWHLEHGNTAGGSENRQRMLQLEKEMSSKMKKCYGDDWTPPYV